MYIIYSRLKNTLGIKLGIEISENTVGNRICLNAKDVSGRISETKCSETYKVDRTAPTGTATIPAYTNTGSVTVSANVTDTGGSGMSNVKFPTWSDAADSSGNGQDDIVWYQVNGAGPTYSTTIDLTAHEPKTEGVYHIHVYGYDNAGNTSNCTISFKKDATKPECGLKLDGTIGDNNWYVSNVGISFNKNTDAMSGVASYGIGSLTASKTATQTADIASKTYTGYIKDNAGNTSNCTVSLKKDATAPECTNRGDSTTWTNGKRTIYYECSDSDSGCSSGGSKTFSSTTTTATIASYTITDAAGNSKVCPARTADVYVDTTAPSITCEKTNTGTTSGVTISCSCRDEDSGVVSCDNGGSNITKTGDHTYYVKDRAGNIKSDSETVTEQKQYKISTWNSCISGKKDECVGGYNTCYNSACGTYACGDWRYTVSYKCKNGTSGSTPSSYMFSSKSEAETACENNGWGVGWENCILESDTSWSCSTSSNKTCNYSCQHENCKWNDCLTTKNTCTGGWTEYSGWQNGSCTADSSTRCLNQTIYN